MLEIQWWPVWLGGKFEGSVCVVDDTILHNVGGEFNKPSSLNLTRTFEQDHVIHVQILVVEKDESWFFLQHWNNLSGQGSFIICESLLVRLLG